MISLARAFETSVLLAEKVAAARSPSGELHEKRALADFTTFGMYKRAALDPAALANLQRGLGWGVGLGVPALGVGHMLLRDAHNQGQDLLRDARNQALMTAAGVGGMQALGDLLKKPPPPTQHNVNLSMPPQQPDLSPDQKLAAAIMIDDVLEAAADQLADPGAKHAALVQLIQHRVDATNLLRSLFA
jgi:hypothetical protein